MLNLHKADNIITKKDNARYRKQYSESREAKIFAFQKSYLRWVVDAGNPGKSAKYDALLSSFRYSFLYLFSTFFTVGEQPELLSEKLKVKINYDPNRVMAYTAACRNSDHSD